MVMLKARPRLGLKAIFLLLNHEITSKEKFDLGRKHENSLGLSWRYEYEFNTWPTLRLAHGSDPKQFTMKNRGTGSLLGRLTRLSYG